jgi:hypothetical protein
MVAVSGETSSNSVGGKKIAPLFEIASFDHLAALEMLTHRVCNRKCRAAGQRQVEYLVGPAQPLSNDTINRRN